MSIALDKTGNLLGESILTYQGANSCNIQKPEQVKRLIRDVWAMVMGDCFLGALGLTGGALSTSSGASLSMTGIGVVCLNRARQNYQNLTILNAYQNDSGFRDYVRDLAGPSIDMARLEAYYKTFCDAHPHSN